MSFKITHSSQGGNFMLSAFYVPMCAIAAIVAYWYLLGWFCVIAIGVMIAQLTIQSYLMRIYPKIRYVPWNRN